MEFQNKPQTQTSTTCYEEQHYSKKDLCQGWPTTEINIPEAATVPDFCHKKGELGNI